MRNLTLFSTFRSVRPRPHLQILVTSLAVSWLRPSRTRILAVCLPQPFFLVSSCLQLAPSACPRFYRCFAQGLSVTSHVTRHCLFELFFCRDLVFDELYARPSADPRVLLRTLLRVLRVVRWSPAPLVFTSALCAWRSLDPEIGCSRSSRSCSHPALVRSC